MSQKGRGKRLNEGQRLEMIEKLSKPDLPTKRAIARTYGISDTAIRKIWNNRDDILLLDLLTSKVEIEVFMNRLT